MDEEVHVSIDRLVEPVDVESDAQLFDSLVERIQMLLPRLEPPNGASSMSVIYRLGNSEALTVRAYLDLPRTDAGDEDDFWEEEEEGMDDDTPSETPQLQLYYHLKLARTYTDSAKYISNDKLWVWVDTVKRTAYAETESILRAHAGFANAANLHFVRKKDRTSHSGPLDTAQLYNILEAMAKIEIIPDTPDSIEP